MKILADLKRIQVGTKLYLVHCLMGPVAPDKQEREVIKVQSNGLWVRIVYNERRSWLPFPKAKDFRPEENGFSVMEDDVVAAQYKFGEK